MAQEQVISRWSLTQAVREVTCPKCGSTAGVYCKTPNGSPAKATHTERSAAYLTKIGREEWDRRHSSNVASGMTAKARLDAIIRSQGTVNAVGSGLATEGKSRWRVTKVTEVTKVPKTEVTED